MSQYTKAVLEELGQLNGDVNEKFDKLLIDKVLAESLKVCQILKSMKSRRQKEKKSRKEKKRPPKRNKMQNHQT